MKNPGDINAPLQTIESVVDLAALTQERLDAIDEEISDHGLFETAGYLDKAAREILLGQQVGIAGIFQKNEPEPESYIGRSSQLVEGLIEGRSNGFTVKRLEDFQPDFYDDEQGEAFEKLRKKAMGSFLVCHMITHRTTKGLAADSSEIVTTEFQAIAPIIASEINLYGEVDDELIKLTKEDTNLLVRSTDRVSRKSIAKMLEVISPADSALDAILKASPYAEKIINRNKQPVVRSLLRALANLKDSSLNDYRYRFKQLPPVLVNHNGQTEIAVLETNFISEVFVDGISAEKKFYLNGSGGIVIPSESRLGIYIDAVAPITPNQNQAFSIPVNLLTPGSYEIV